MDFEQAGKLILGVVFLILMISLVIVRRGMKPESKPALTVSTLQIDLQCDTGPTLAALKPVTAELQRQAELAERVTAAQCRAFDNAEAAKREPAKKPTQERNQKQTRKVRAGTSR